MRQFWRNCWAYCLFWFTRFRSSKKQTIRIEEIPGFAVTMPDPANGAELLRFAGTFNQWAIKEYLRGLNEQQNRPTQTKQCYADARRVD